MISETARIFAIEVIERALLTLTVMMGTYEDEKNINLTMVLRN